jgi:hypothetical protein
MRRNSIAAVGDWRVATVPTAWVFSIGAVVFLVLAAVRVVQEHGKVAGAARTWMIVGGVFALVALYLALRT